MANWTILKEAIAHVIKTNGNQEITGAVLQNTLNSIVNSVGENATFAGIATPTTNPGTPDGPVFYIATTAGSYSNFGNIKISKGESAILKWNNGIWTKNTFKPMTDFNSVYDLDGNNLAKTFERLHTKVSSKADLSNSEQSISAKKVLVTGGYEIGNQGEEATISYDGGVQDGNSFLKFTDSQNGGLIKLVFDGTEDTIATQNQFNSRINPISSRVDTIEQDMAYVNEMVPNLKLRCDNLEEDAKIVLASMGTSVDNEGNNSDVAIMYVPLVGDRYYDTSTGHIKYVKSSTVTEDLGLPSADRIYCNRMTKRLYVFKDGWKKVGEPNEDLSSLKSNVASNSENIQSIASALSTKVDKTDITQSTGTSETAVMSQKAVSDAINKLASKTIYADESVNFDEVGYYDAKHFFYRIKAAQNTGFVFIDGYERVSCNVNLTSDGYAIAFFDDNKTFISGLLGDERQGIYNANVPNGAKYVVFSNYGSGPKNATIYSGETLIKRIGEIENDMVAKSSAITFPSPVGNLFDKSKVIVGREVYGDGSLQLEPQSAASDYINVMGQKTLFFNNLPIYVGYRRYLFFYDSEKTPISSTWLSCSESKSTVNIPTNAAYLRFSLYQRWKSGSKDYESVMVTIGEYKEYEPYIEYLSSIGGFNIPKIDTSALILKTAGKKALIFGDSITETATISDDGNTYTEGVRVNWPTFALPMLGIKDFRNYGMSGATYKDTGSTQYRQNVSEQITMAMANSYNDDANIVIMSLGTNDGSENIGSFDTAMGKTTLESLDRTNLYEALRWAMWTLRTKYKDAIFYVGLPIQRASKEQPNTMLDAIREMAHRYNFIVIEAINESGIIRDFETSGSEGRYLYDGLHPNSEGSRLIGALYANKILTNYLVGR